MYKLLKRDAIFMKKNCFQFVSNFEKEKLFFLFYEKVKSFLFVSHF